MLETACDLPSLQDWMIPSRPNFHRLTPMATSCHHFVAKTPTPISIG
ncbi:hypothetical protein RISK_005784 [Rhodopirellula islandica]|uniref:Uncharacterized protein n=1 Tax=Rhodopirellula islandica TaxID=595434 RepID=A0A0J1B823_RHOIS|nr:hypothetical protein RISK_005784 [Rhodopirellula islandica]